MKAQAKRIKISALAVAISSCGVINLANADVCSHFSPDDEDEQIDDVPTSCFNCMKRRWLKSGLECIQLKL